MTDLHTRLHAAITDRLEAATAAQATNLGLSVSTARQGGKNALMGHLLANSPAVIIRMCQRDLKVLARHARVFGSTSDEAWDRNPICDYERHPWPCEDVRDLAEAYGVSG